MRLEAIDHTGQRPAVKSSPAPPIQHQSKRCLLDGLGSLLARGDRVSAMMAALANDFAANALDMDDGHRLIKGQPGSPFYPILLATSEMEPVTGQAFLIALVIGYEVGIRADLIRHHTLPTYHSSGSWMVMAGAATAGHGIWIPRFPQT